MNRVAIYCGSSMGNEDHYEIHAKELGRKLALENIELVYGGAKVGLMGVVADGVLENSGQVIGVLPHFLKSKEIAHDGLSELILVDSMHERKTKMNELCDGVIALPVGFGTLEELFEMLTWGQLGLHKKPIGILNVNGFFDELIRFLDKMVDKEFLKDSNRKMILVSKNMDDLLAQMRTYKAPTIEKWITKENI